MWKKLNSDEPETIYVSQATDYDSICEDLTQVVQRMVDNAEVDKVPADAKILFYTNATNGYVRVNWLNGKGKAAGTWFYTLNLPALWAESNEHPEGSFHFDNEVHIAICTTVEYAEDIFGELADTYDVFTQTELREREQLFL